MMVCQYFSNNILTEIQHLGSNYKQRELNCQWWLSLKRCAGPLSGQNWRNPQLAACCLPLYEVHWFTIPVYFPIFHSVTDTLSCCVILPEVYVANEGTEWEIWCARSKRDSSFSIATDERPEAKDDTDHSLASWPLFWCLFQQPTMPSASVPSAAWVLDNDVAQEPGVKLTHTYI